MKLYAKFHKLVLFVPLTSCLHALKEKLTQQQLSIIFVLQQVPPSRVTLDHISPLEFFSESCTVSVKPKKFKIVLHLIIVACTQRRRERHTFVIFPEYCLERLIELKNVPRVFHVETAWKRPFPRRFNVEYMWCVCSVYRFN